MNGMLARLVGFAATYLALAAVAVAGPLDAADAAIKHRDYPSALRIYRQAAAQGDAEAQYNLGVMYDMGEGMPEDDRGAVGWYGKAAAQGYAFAQFNLGMMYDRGDGVPMNYLQSVIWLRKAADQGLGVAQRQLGHMYGSGQGVPSDDVQALLWLSLAADQGITNAKRERDIVKNRMTAGEVSYSQVLRSEWTAAHPR